MKRNPSNSRTSAPRTLDTRALRAVTGGLTAFQNIDVKIQQTYDLVSSVTKTTGELRGIDGSTRTGL